MFWKFLCTEGWGWDLFQTLLLGVTIVVAGSQLSKQAKAEKITALAKLRELLTSEKSMEVHRLLSPKKEQWKVLKDKEIDNAYWVDVFNYLGTLELGVIMNEEKIIEEEEFCSQFGYRIENIFEESNDFHKKVQEHIYKEDGKYYKTLLRGREIMKRYEQNNLKN